MSKLNCTAKQAFWNARKKDGDVQTISEVTGYSVSHVSNIISGRRRNNDIIADAMYKVSRRRIKNSERVR
jgi:hypothetical protein